MKRLSTLAFFFPVFGCALAACAFDADIARVNSDSAAIACGAGQRLFNGACRTLCSSSSQCDQGTQCFAIDQGASACLPYQHCSYLASDTACVGSGSIYGSSEYDDGNYASGDPYGSGDCQGNASFVKIDATGDVGCGQPHDVVRCRRVGDQCVFVPTTTTDLVSP
jgi:hypothetical protein